MVTVVNPAKEFGFQSHLLLNYNLGCGKKTNNIWLGVITIVHVVSTGLVLVYRLKPIGQELSHTTYRQN